MAHLSKSLLIQAFSNYERTRLTVRFREVYEDSLAKQFNSIRYRMDLVTTEDKQTTVERVNSDTQNKVSVLICF